MCKKKESPRPDTQNDNANDIEAPEPPPIPRNIYCNENNSLDSDDEQYHHDIPYYNRHINPTDILRSYRPSIDMNNISDTHRKATRHYAIRKKKKLTDVFKF